MVVMRMARMLLHLWTHHEHARRMLIDVMVWRRWLHWKDVVVKRIRGNYCPTSVYVT